MASYEYDANNDLYIDTDGQQYVKNEFDPNIPLFINITNDLWEGTRCGQVHFLNWKEFANFHPNVLDAVKIILKLRLKRCSPSYLRSLRLALTALNSTKEIKKCSTWGDLTITDWLTIWGEINGHAKSTLRSIYRTLATKGMGGAKLTISHELSRWSVKKNYVPLKVVRAWDANLGSLTAQEIELVRNSLSQNEKRLSHREASGRIALWIILETFKRSSQVTGLEKEALQKVDSQYFLNIAGVKAQTGNSDWWPISPELAHAISIYSARADINRLQQRHNRLIVADLPSLRATGQVSSPEFKDLIQKSYIGTLEIISPRTNEPLNITPMRLRHTGGTKFAEHGFSRDVIAEILEHDSFLSADAYIDAIGSDLIPAVQKADRNLGGLFEGLSNIFFNGEVVEEVDFNKSPPIYIPIIDASPALVGGCGRDSMKEGMCSRHPFFGCYDSCPYFLAWKDGDHQKALQYVESEYVRWDLADGRKERWKAKSEFERVHKAIQEVIEQSLDNSK